MLHRRKNLDILSEILNFTYSNDTGINLVITKNVKLYQQMLKIGNVFFLWNL